MPEPTLSQRARELLASEPDGRLIEQLSADHEGPIADAARRIASWTEPSTGRTNVYVAAKSELARVVAKALSSPIGEGVRDEVIEECVRILNAMEPPRRHWIHRTTAIERIRSLTPGHMGEARG